MLALGAAQFVFGLVLFGTGISLPVTAIYDAMSFPPARWQQVGEDRRRWVTLLAVGLIPFGLLGIVVAIRYLRRVRPRLAVAPG